MDKPHVADSGGAKRAGKRARPADAAVVGVLFDVADQGDGAGLVLLIGQRDRDVEEGAAGWLSVLPGASKWPG